jgi:hypothetical protein
MLMNGSLKLEGDSRSFVVEHWFSEDRAIIQFEGIYALVDRTGGDVFELSATPASEFEAAVLKPLIASIQTTTTVTPINQNDIVTEPEPLESESLDESGEFAAPLAGEPAPTRRGLASVRLPGHEGRPRTAVRYEEKKPRPGFCHCGTALSVAHVHANAPNLDKCWCGLYLAHAHSHAAAPVEAIGRCHCGILLSMPHEHAEVADPAEKCWCGIAKNPPHAHASGPRSH